MTSLMITADSYRTNETHHRLAEQVMAAHGLDPNKVKRIELSERDAVVWTMAAKWAHVAWPCGPLHKIGCGCTCTHFGLFEVRRRYPNPGTRRAAA